MFDETTATVDIETGTYDGTESSVSVDNEETTTDRSGGDALADVLDTPSLALPVAQAEVHRGTVVSVETQTSTQTGNTYGTIHLQSIDTGASGKNHDINFFPPQAWFEQWEGGKFNVDLLSDEPPPGKKQTPKQAFARAVSSTQASQTKDGQPIPLTQITGKEGTLQLLRKLAAIDGLTLEPGTPTPTNGEEYVALINSLVAGKLEVVYTRKPEKNDDPAFDGQLKANAIFPRTIIGEPSFEKRFKGFRIMAAG